MEAKQHQGCTVRHTQKKNLYLEWNSIFLNPKCVPSSPPTLFSSLVLLLDKHYSFVNGLPPCSHPRIRYSIKTWGILLWLLVSCFLWKIQPPLSHTNTLMYSTAHHTHQTEQAWDQLLKPQSKYILVCECLYLQSWLQTFGNVVNINIILPLGFIKWYDGVFSLFRSNILAYFWLGITNSDIVVVSVQPCEIHCHIVSKSLCYMVTRTAVLPHSSQHFICFYSLYTYPHFTCQGGRCTSVRGPLKQQ